jgi:hypothetical protein
LTCVSQEITPINVKIVSCQSNFDFRPVMGGRTHTQEGRSAQRFVSELMTLRELAYFLNVPQRELYLLAAHRKATGFPAKKIGSVWLAELQEVKGWIVDCEEKSFRPLDVARQRESARRKRSSGRKPGARKMSLRRHPRQR